MKHQRHALPFDPRRPIGSLCIKPVARLLLLALPIAGPAVAAWPPRFDSSNGWSLVPSASWQYDALHARTREGDLNLDAFRRQRSALVLASPGGHYLKLDYDFSAGVWADLAVRINLDGRGGLRIGQIKTPIGLEVLASHRAISHFERSPAAALLPGRRLGLEWSLARDSSTVTVAAIGDNIDDLARGRGVFARATRQIGSDPLGVRWHLGIGAGVEWPDSAQRFRGRPEVSLAPLTLADSGTFVDVDRLDRVATEAAFDRGAMSVQAEHVELRGERDSGGFDARGTYLAVSWRPTGEARRYRNGIVDALQPGGDRGAVELVARASRLDVPRSDGAGQSGRSISAGVNWYINGNVKLMAQATSARPDAGGDQRIYGLRLHYLF